VANDASSSSVVATTNALDNDAGPSSPPPKAHCGNQRWVPNFCYVRDPGDPSAGTAEPLDPEAWLTTHGAKAADVKAQTSTLMLGAMCRALSAGPDKEEALFCMYHTQSVEKTAGSVYRGVQRARILVVRKTAVTILLDIPFSFANFDSPGPPSEGDETEIFGLVVDTRESATKIIVSEPRPGECAAAAKKNAAEITTRLQQKPVVPVEIAMMRFDAKLLTTICSAAKTYAWTKGSYRSS
jgi:hypothetical protein